MAGGVAEPSRVTLSVPATPRLRVRLRPGRNEAKLVSSLAWRGRAAVLPRWRGPVLVCGELWGPPRWRRLDLGPGTISTNFAEDITASDPRRYARETAAALVSRSPEGESERAL